MTQFLERSVILNALFAQSGDYRWPEGCIVLWLGLQRIKMDLVSIAESQLLDDFAARLRKLMGQPDEITLHHGGYYSCDFGNYDNQPTFQGEGQCHPGRRTGGPSLPTAIDSRVDRMMEIGR